MQIRFLTSWDERCGIAQYSRGLVEALRRSASVEVVPATFNRAPRSVYRAMGVALNDGDVAHVQHSYAFFGGLHPLRSGWAALAGAIRRPLLVTVHELDLRPGVGRRLPPALEAAYKRQYNRSVFLHPAVSHLVVHSPVLRDELIELGARPERVSYLPMPMDPPPVAPANPAPWVRKFGLTGKRPLVILGFLSRRKGYAVALRALQALPEEYVLVAAGGEHEADATGTEAWLRSEAQRAGLEPRVRITGYLPDDELEQAAAAADVVLAPFLEMSASASLSYALARGKAVIASDLLPNRELDCVRLVPVGDAAALAEAVRAVAETPKTKLELERAALRHAGNHSYGALAEETIGLYNQLLQLEAR
ncbi:MAG: glycosyltransferase [Actinomycetota bacterium]